MYFHLSTPSDLKAVHEYLGGLLFEGKRYIVEIKRKYDKRTIDQNALMWLWLTCIEQETGQPKEDLHEFFKMKFLGAEERSMFNMTFFIPKSTTKLDTKVMGEYLTQIQIFAATELGITLPDPNDLHFEEFYSYYKAYL